MSIHKKSLILILLFNIFSINSGVLDYFSWFRAVNESRMTRRIVGGVTFGLGAAFCSVPLVGVAYITGLGICSGEAWNHLNDSSIRNANTRKDLNLALADLKKGETHLGVTKQTLEKTQKDLKNSNRMLVRTGEMASDTRGVIELTGEKLEEVRGVVIEASEKISSMEKSIDEVGKKQRREFARKYLLKCGHVGRVLSLQFFLDRLSAAVGSLEENCKEVEADIVGAQSSLDEVKTDIAAMQKRADSDYEVLRSLSKVTIADVRRTSFNVDDESKFESSVREFVEVGTQTKPRAVKDLGMMIFASSVNALNKKPKT